MCWRSDGYVCYFVCVCVRVCVCACVCACVPVRLVNVVALFLCAAGSHSSSQAQKKSRRDSALDPTLSSASQHSRSERDAHRHETRTTRKKEGRKERQTRRLTTKGTPEPSISCPFPLSSSLSLAPVAHTSRTPETVATAAYYAAALRTLPAFSRHCALSLSLPSPFSLVVPSLLLFGPAYAL